MLDMQSSFASLLSDSPGSRTLMEISIDTGSVPPFQLCPYDALLADSIIEASVSPWSSLMLPVNKDISVCICIDFRRLNAVAIADPYLMPRVDAIIDCLGNAVFLSKFDLVKGSIRSL